MAGTFNVCDPHFAILLICYSLKVFYGFKSKENSSHKNYTGQTRVGQLLEMPKRVASAFPKFCLWVTLRLK